MRATVLNFLRLCSLYVVAQTTSASQFSFATRLPVSSRRSKQFPGIDTTKRLTNEELSPLLRLRGGENFSSIVDYVGQSNARCWISLFLAVCMDATSTALLKVGRDKSSIITILAAYGGFFFSLSGFAMSLGKIDVSTAYAVSLSLLSKHYIIYVAFDSTSYHWC